MNFAPKNQNKTKISVIKLQRRIYGANLALHYFITTHWIFKNAKFLALNDLIKPEDIIDFRFDRFVTGDIRKYFIACMYGKCLLLRTLHLLPSPSFVSFCSSHANERICAQNQNYLLILT